MLKSLHDDHEHVEQHCLPLGDLDYVMRWVMVAELIFHEVYPEI